MKTRGCLNNKKQQGRKKCRYFKQYDEHPVWDEIERVKVKKKNWKKRINEQMDKYT